MTKISSQDDLRRLYKMPKGRPVDKQLDHIDPHDQRFIELSPFVVIASSDSQGHADTSPRGEAPGFVHVIDA
ncbi:MAG TPA: pyridoxamine 5'-phosphate oxidase family protein, partial [Rhodospirillales bacterium]|nr:pyridoxamine 5'-phosphate oxidase family protein [Rhodospirillales bacterium]